MTMHCHRLEGIAGTQAASGSNDEAPILAGGRRKQSHATEIATGIITATKRLRPRRVMCFLAPRERLLLRGSQGHSTRYGQNKKKPRRDAGVWAHVFLWHC